MNFSTILSFHFFISVTLCLGIVFIVLGVCLKFAILPVVVDSMLMSQLKLEPSNEETWEAFITPPVTPYMKFTFFEVQVGFLFNSMSYVILLLHKES